MVHMAHHHSKRPFSKVAGGVAIAVSLLMNLTAVRAAESAGGTYDHLLRFDKSKFTTITVRIDGQSVPVRWYKEVCYVAKPTLMSSSQTDLMRGAMTIANPECGYQSMNIFVPESAAGSQDAAIYFAVNNGGWFASYIKASVTDGASYDSATSNVGAALKAGYVYIDVATRSRGVLAADGSFGGKAPAPVIDAKAAIRYLRLNDAVMPGSAERIVVNGTSGGGALSAIIGASGNSGDYLPYLDQVGAAGIDSRGASRHSTLHDDVLAINAYCPITDLGNADVTYEWLYTVLHTRATVGTNPNPAGSAELAAKFPAYQASLHLTTAGGAPLTADNMIETIKQEVIKAAVRYMDAGGTIPALGDNFVVTGGFPVPKTASYKNDWIRVDAAAKKVISIDMERYLAFVATQEKLKSAPAFDQSGLTVTEGRGESNLFGTNKQPYSNFTAYSWDHNNVHNDGIGLDDTGLTFAKYTQTSGTLIDEQVKLINPLRYIGKHVDTAPYWYIRNGTRDRDTSFIVSLDLSRALASDKHVKRLDYALAWNQPHSGNYDVPEAMAWIAEVLKEAGRNSR
jgi:hypothetical protein